MKVTLSTINGIIIRMTPYSDRDLVLKVLSPERGKLALFARGARTNRKRFAASFDLFDTGSFSVKQGRSTMLLVDSFMPTPSFKTLRTDLEKLTMASLLCECFDLLNPEDGGKSEDVYNILALGLRAIDQASSVREALRAAFFITKRITRGHWIYG